MSLFQNQVFLKSQLAMQTICCIQNALNSYNKNLRRFHLNGNDIGIIKSFPLLFPLSVHSLDKCLHPGRTFPLHFLGDMAIDIKGERCRSMAEILLDGLYIIPGL